MGNLIPVDTIHSIIKQKYEPYEVILLQNGVATMPEGEYVREADVDRVYCFDSSKIKKLEIKRKGKSRALNIGIKEARYDYVCVIDADCILKDGALVIAMKHFEDRSVSAVGGRLWVRNIRCNPLTWCEKLEYMKTFNIWRPLYNALNANYIISGAYGIFRKADITLVDGYDTNSVGEDMELVLSLQTYLHSKKNAVRYERRSICFTRVPYSLRKLLRQRDRWQRGLLDSIKKHWDLIFNSKYGALGLITMPYQAFWGLFKPVFILLNFINIICSIFNIRRYFEIIQLIKYYALFGLALDAIIPQSWYVYLGYLAFEVILTCIAESIEYEEINGFFFVDALFATALGALLSVPLAVARLWGMITFHWRKMKW